MCRPGKVRWGTQERPAEVRAPPPAKARPPLDLLRHDLSEQVGLREVLRPDDDLVVSGAPHHGSESGQQQPSDYRCHASLRSSSPRAPSAASAISAAGIAPARINVSSTTATPRKM